MTVLDDMNQIDNWKTATDPGYAYNMIEQADTDNDTIYDALRFCFAKETGDLYPYNFGTSFYKRPSGDGIWDLTNEPLMSIRISVDDISKLPELRLEVVTGAGWKVSIWNLANRVTASLQTIEIDLRTPDAGELPELDYVVQIGFAQWDVRIDYPGPSVLVENIDVGTAPLGAWIEPSEITITVGKNATFKAIVSGGSPPFSYAWYLDDVLTPGTSDTLIVQGYTIGTFSIKCEVTGQITTVYAQATLIVSEAPPPPPPIPSGPDVLKSEVRGIFIHMWWGDPNLDWNLIAQTCADYGNNMAVIEIYKNHLWQNGSIISLPELRKAIQAFHSRGINVHVLLVVGLGTFNGMETLTSSGDTDWLDFSKQSAKQMLTDVATTISRDYNIDGFMFDYIRWDFGGRDRPIGEEAREAFIANTGKTDVVWPSDILEGGRYYWDFIQWRILPVTEAVRDMSSIMRHYKPNLEISAAVQTAFDECGNYWVMGIGQHPADWVDKGYMDFLSPMLYSGDSAENGSNLSDSMTFYTAGPEGKVPMIPFIKTHEATTNKVIDDVSQMKQQGSDGWIAWCYGGPGLLYGDLVDVRPLLNAVMLAGYMMDPTWAIQNVKVTKTLYEATITWRTTEPITSKIEYADVPLFVGTEKYGDFGRPFYYKDMEYVGGTVQEDPALKTEHSFTITSTDQTQFRIQSIDIKGNVISTKPMLVSEAPPKPSIPSWLWLAPIALILFRGKKKG